LAILSLLLKQELSQAHKLAREAFEGDPSRMEYVVTYAYSLHVQNKTEEAVELLRELRADSFTKPTFAAYAGVILAAAGERAEAKDLLEKASQGSLLEEEKKLVAQAMRER
jgi:tetratricopeptide (TPR) repeat protein